MKKLNFTAFFLLLFLSLALTACNETEEVPEVDTAEKEEIQSNLRDCLTGRWTRQDNDKNMQFVFSADSTGFENTGDGAGERPFTWKLKDSVPVISYELSTQEWKMTLDCDKKELTVMGLTYKKN